MVIRWYKAGTAGWYGYVCRRLLFTQAIILVASEGGGWLVPNVEWKNGRFSRNKISNLAIMDLLYKTMPICLAIVSIR